MPSAYQEAAITMVREGLRSAERELKQNLAQAELSLHEACLQKEVHQTEVGNAETRQMELKRIINEAKIDIRESTKAIETSKHGLQVMQHLQKSSQDRLEEDAAK